ncbi:MAG: peptidoglycan-binding protein [Actinobacteria bacterium]|nr:peptidoglycan-binding protein [Actinomycetota bacterium]
MADPFVNAAFQWAFLQRSLAPLHCSAESGSAALLAPLHWLRCSLSAAVATLPLAALVRDNLHSLVFHLGRLVNTADNRNPRRRRLRCNRLAAAITASAIVALVASSIALATPQRASAAASPFNTQGMWIWYVSKTEGGDVARIARKARRAKVRTLFIKSGDGVNYWQQFDLAAASLKSAGLRVCAWQYVYGSDPAAEADAAARAVTAGADCLVIDAEREYGNRYDAAQTYITTLRARIGPDYPLALTSYAYPDYHPTLPYSVFLGPGGATWNLPQMYFKAFGKPVSEVFAHTYGSSQVYGRAIRPLGQTYGGVSAAQVIEFRKQARLYGARGYSWWVWTDTRRDAWIALRRKLRRSTVRAVPPAYPELAQGAKGDLVRWAQMHLVAAGQQLDVDGEFDAEMKLILQGFQQQQGLPLSGRIDQVTWPALLAVPLPA